MTDYDEIHQIESYSLAFREAEEDDIAVMTACKDSKRYRNISEADYRLSQLKSLDRCQFSKQDFSAISSTGELQYRKKCEELFLAPIEKFVQVLHDEENSINLSHYGIGDDGVQALSVAIPVNRFIKDIRLKQNDISDTGGEQLVQALSQSESVEIIDLSCNNIKFGTINALAGVLNSTSIVYLDLSNNKLQDSDIKPLWETLAENTKLQSLKLSRNRFSYKSCEALSVMLRENGTIGELDLSWNPLHGRGAKLIFEALLENTGIKILDLSWCGVDDRAGSAISKLLEEGDYLEQLDLSNNRLSASSGPSLALAITDNSSLKMFDLSANPFGDAVHRLEEALTNSRIEIKKFDGMDVFLLDANLHMIENDCQSKLEQIIAQTDLTSS